MFKPSTISKPDLSNNFCNVHNVSSIIINHNQLVKAFNVTKTLFFQNASNSVIFPKGP